VLAEKWNFGVFEVNHEAACLTVKWSECPMLDDCVAMLLFGLSEKSLVYPISNSKWCIIIGVVS
jgi:hypothetical protein